MSTDIAIEQSVEAASESVGAVWPLHSFVTANPLAGFEDQPFHEAVAEAETLLGGDGYPSPDVFRQAWEASQIDPEIVEQQLAAHGYVSAPEVSLQQLSERADDAVDDDSETAASTHQVDAVMAKWLAAFLDQGEAAWSMPNREEGFYAAFRAVAPYDSEIPDSDRLDALPDEPADAIRELLSGHPVGAWQDIFAFHLTALPGWTGFIKQRAADGGAWQSTYPITLTEYVAVRLFLADVFDAPIAPEDTPDEADAADDDQIPLPEVWLRAWEATYRSDLVDSLTEASESVEEEPAEDRSDAQLVFCIDTRSEIIRRHLEAVGDYETHGYAGFFGIQMRYAGYDSDVTIDSCPPILDAQHHIADRPTSTGDAAQHEYDRWRDTFSVAEKAVKDLKSNAATAFSFVESTGVAYGAALAARTLLPGQVYDLLSRVDEQSPDAHEFCEPSLEHEPHAVDDLPQGLTLDEKVTYAETAFSLMGWEQFARVVVFTGHASQTTNNPFGSSLDCGACAGNAGGPNARVLAAICNDDDVKAELRDRGIDIPEDTVFVAGEHNTTTDEVELYDGDVPETHEDDLKQLRADLADARAGAAAERAGDMGHKESGGVRETARRAADWAETRPEWGLAGNAGFVVGPRALTDDLDLDGRSFLHSYDWRTDPDGDALEAIMTGPLVVTQWINAQYYFSTVDNAVYGSGSKVTQNPTGNVGVYQGNGGDLMTGLPLQSLMSADEQPYHQPLRLSTVLHAPIERVTEILAEHDDVRQLLDNGWLSLTVVDPEQEHAAFQYESELAWTPVSEQAVAQPELDVSPEIQSTPAAADD